MQRFVRLHPHVIPIEQAVELNTREREHRLPNTRPVKAMPLKSLVPENEAVALPHQDLELVTSRIDEGEHRPLQRVLLDHVSRQNRQAVDLLPHINWRAVQIHPLDAPIRAQHPLAPPAPLTPSSALATRHTRWPTLARTPGGTPGRCAPPERPRSPRPTSSSPVAPQNGSCACVAGLSPAVHRAGAAPRSRRTPAAPQGRAPSRNRSASCQPAWPPARPPPQPVASASASPSSRTSTSRRRYNAGIELTMEERASLSAYAGAAFRNSEIERWCGKVLPASAPKSR